MDKFDQGATQLSRSVAAGNDRGWRIRPARSITQPASITCLPPNCAYRSRFETCA